MSLPFLILRPKGVAEETAGRAKDLGLDTIVDPLFEIKPLAWDGPTANGYDGLLLSSSNAVKYAGEALSDYRDLPVLAVGKATAAAATKLGFSVDVVGKKGVQSLIDGISKEEYPRLLRLTGEHYTSIVDDTISVTTIAVYQSVALALGPKALESLKTGTIVALYSVRAAQMLFEQMDQWQLDKSKSHVVALSPAVAHAAGKGWKSVAVAAMPSDDALLSIAARLCRKPV